jgi:hypothetical protein
LEIEKQEKARQGTHFIWVLEQFHGFQRNNQLSRFLLQKQSI